MSTIREHRFYVKKVIKDAFFIINDFQGKINGIFEKVSVAHRFGFLFF